MATDKRVWSKAKVSGRDILIQTMPYGFNRLPTESALIWNRLCSIDLSDYPPSQLWYESDYAVKIYQTTYQVSFDMKQCM